MPAGGLESRMRARSRASLAERAWRSEGKMPLPDNVIQHFLFRCRQVAQGVFRHFVLGFDTLLSRTSRFRITKCQNGCRGKAGVGICRRPGRVSNFEARAQVWVAIATEHSVERLRLRCDFSRRLGGRGGACLDGAFEWHQAPGNASPISSARPGVSRLTAPPPAARHEWAGMCSKPNGRPAGSRDCARPVRPANR